MNEERQAAMEEWVIDFLDQKRQEKKITVEAWAKYVYPNISAHSARMRIQHLRKPQGASGKRKRLLYAEFVRMAQCLSLSPAEIVALSTQAFSEADF